MFDSLSEKLQGALAGVRQRGALTEEDISRAMREIRLALLEADVNFKVVKQFTSTVKERALGIEVQKQLNPGQQVIKIVNEELTALMGGASAGLSFSPRPPTVILMAGLQGSGKTTATAKLAKLLKEQNGSSVAVAACDVYRPAAVEQLIKVGGQAGATVYEQGTDKDPVDIAGWALDQAKRDGKDVLIVDTSGRLHVDQALMEELANVKKRVKPHVVLLVVDAMTGQDAVNVAEQFAEVAQFDGVILSKLDGDARGGAALSVKAVTGKPIMYASTGEKLGDFEKFHPDRMAQRILGMGDVLSFIEKAEQSVDEDEAKALEKKLRKNQFTLEDFLDQLKRIRKMGPLTSLLGMIPGLAGHQLSKLQVDERELDRVEAIILSMTPEERAPARADQGPAPPAHRQGLGHHRPAGQPAGQAVRRDAQDDEGPLLGEDARSRRADAAAIIRSAILLGRYVRLHASHPRRREEGPRLAGRRRRSPFPSRRPRHRDDRPLQRPDRAVDRRARRGAREAVALPRRAAVGHGPQAAQDPGHRRPPLDARAARLPGACAGRPARSRRGRAVRGGRRHARARAVGGRR